MAGGLVWSGGRQPRPTRVQPGPRAGNALFFPSCLSSSLIPPGGACLLHKPPVQRLFSRFRAKVIEGREGEDRGKDGEGEREGGKDGERKRIQAQEKRVFLAFSVKGISRSNF